MYFLRNARLVWLSQNGQLYLALLGWDSNPSVTAEFLQQNGAGLDTSTIQALLNLDPLVPSPSGPLNPPRFVYVETVELQGSDQTYTFSHSVTVQDTQSTTRFITNLTDERKGWMSFLGIGPSQTQTTTSTVTQTISSATTVGEVTTVTASFYAAASEFYAVTVYYDTVFGAFAFTPAPVGFQPIISGTLRNALGQPEALQVVTLTNTGPKLTTRKFTTRTNKQGQFAFHSTTIEPGDSLLVGGAARKQFVFSGKPLQGLELHP